MKKVLKVTVDVLVWVVLILALLVTVTVLTSTKNEGIPRLFGYTPMSVQSDSMKPTFSKGDLIIVHKVDDVTKLKVDDVITFHAVVENHEIINTHRIVEINKDENGMPQSFVTRGDNNPVDDEDEVMVDKLIGEWTGTSFGKLGVALDFLQTQKGFFICIIIPIAIIFLFELYKFIVALIEVKNEGKLTEEDEEEIKKKAIEEYLAQQKKEAEATANKAEDAVNETKDAVAETAEAVAKTAEEVASEAEAVAKATVETSESETK